MDVSTEILGLTQGADLSLEDADELLTEVSEKAEDIIERAYAEFNSFLKKKGLRNSMGVLTPKDGAKVLYHITDIEWDLDDEDDINAESLRDELSSDLQGECIADYISKSDMMEELDKFDEWLETANIGDTYCHGDSSYVLEKIGDNLPENVDAQNIHGTVADYLSDTYYYLVKSYKVSVEIIDESEDSHYEKFKAALWNAGTDAIEDFCDVTFSGYENDAVIDTLIDDTIAQMPDDVFDEYYKQYVEEDCNND